MLLVNKLFGGYCHWNTLVNWINGCCWPRRCKVEEAKISNHYIFCLLLGVGLYFNFSDRIDVFKIVSLLYTSLSCTFNFLMLKIWDHVWIKWWFKVSETELDLESVSIVLGWWSFCLRSDIQIIFLHCVLDSTNNISAESHSLFWIKKKNIFFIVFSEKSIKSCLTIWTSMYHCKHIPNHINPSGAEKPIENQKRRPS